MPHMPFNFGPVFETALDYESYLQQYGTEGDIRNWNTIFESIKLTDDQVRVLNSFTRELRLLGMSGAWCGDCVAQCPIWKKFADVSDKIQLRLIDRDANEDLAAELQICGAPRVPQLVIMSEDNLPVARLGDRTLSKYRAMGSGLLGLEPTNSSTADVVQDWLDEFERAHYILRMSPSLRAKHGD